PSAAKKIRATPYTGLSIAWYSPFIRLDLEVSYELDGAFSPTAVLRCGSDVGADRYVYHYRPRHRHFGRRDRESSGVDCPDLDQLPVLGGHKRGRHLSRPLAPAWPVPGLLRGLGF